MTTALREPDDPEVFGGELFAARREATAAVRALETASPLTIEVYAERARVAAGALANLASLASLAARRARR